MVVVKRFARHLLILLGSMSLLLSSFSWAATADGRYGVRGAALVPCSVYEKERQAQSELYQMLLSWVDGYITGVNQQANGVFDISSFESTELLATILSEHCKKNPQHTLFSVVTLLVGKIANNKLSEHSEKISVELAERKIFLYQETLRRMQAKLSSMGFYHTEYEGGFTPELRDALKAYQQSIHFKPTGFPDQLTLWRLFYDSE